MNGDPYKKFLSHDRMVTFQLSSAQPQIQHDIQRKFQLSGNISTKQG